MGRRSGAQRANEYGPGCRYYTSDLSLPAPCKLTPHHGSNSGIFGLQNRLRNMLSPPARKPCLPLGCHWRRFVHLCLALSLCAITEPRVPPSSPSLPLSFCPAITPWRRGRVAGDMAGFGGALQRDGRRELDVHPGSRNMGSQCRLPGARCGHGNSTRHRQRRPVVISEWRWWIRRSVTVVDPAEVAVVDPAEVAVVDARPRRWR